MSLGVHCVRLLHFALEERFANTGDKTLLFLHTMLHALEYTSVLPKLEVHT